MYKQKYYKYLQKRGSFLNDDLLFNIFNYLDYFDKIHIIGNIPNIKNQLRESQYYKDKKVSFFYWEELLFNKDKYFDKDALSNEYFKKSNILYRHKILRIPRDCIRWSYDNTNRFCHGNCIYDSKGKIITELKFNDAIFQIQGRKYDIRESINSVDWSPDGNRICTGSWAPGIGAVQIWDSKTGVCLQTLFNDIHNQSSVRSVSWNNNGLNYFCCGSSDSKIKIWNSDYDHISTLVLDGIDKKNPEWQNGPYINCVCWSNDGTNRICCGTTMERSQECVGILYIWTIFNNNTGKFLNKPQDIDSIPENKLVWKCSKKIKGHRVGVDCVSWNNHGNNLICSGSAHIIAVCDPETTYWGSFKRYAYGNDFLKVFKGHKSNIKSVSWISNQIICSVSDDNTLRLWDYNKGTCLKVMNFKNYYAHSISWNKKINKLCVASNREIKSKYKNENFHEIIIFDSIQQFNNEQDISEESNNSELWYDFNV